MPRTELLPPGHQFLRRATARIHHRLDRTSILAELVRPGLTLDRYRTAMDSLHGAYHAIDQWLLAAEDVCPREIAGYFPRCPALASDLGVLGVDVFPRASASDISNLPVRASAASYLGIRYVVEGASFGSRFICRSLRDVFGDDLHSFGSFWIASLSQTSCWHGVLQSLGHLESRSALAEAALSARVAFRHMDARLTPVFGRTL